MPILGKHLLFSSKFSRYVVGGGVSYLFVLSQMYLYIHLMKIPHAVAYAFTKVCTLIIFFLISRHWIFNSVVEHTLRQAIKFLYVHGVFRVVDWCLFVLLNVYIGMKYGVSIFLAMGFVFFIKYFAYGRIVFRGKEDQDIAKKTYW